VTLIEQDLAAVEQRLHQLRRDIKRFASYSGDRNGSVLLRVEADEMLRQLRRDLRVFARCQYGVELDPK
jgi:hypothetical protein